MEIEKSTGKFEDERSEIEDEGSEIEDEGSEIEDEGSEIEETQSEKSEDDEEELSGSDLERKIIGFSISKPPETEEKFEVFPISTSEEPVIEISPGKSEQPVITSLSTPIEEGSDLPSSSSSLILESSSITGFEPEIEISTKESELYRISKAEPAKSRRGEVVEGQYRARFSRYAPASEVKAEKTTLKEEEQLETKSQIKVSQKSEEQIEKERREYLKKYSFHKKDETDQSYSYRLRYALLGIRFVPVANADILSRIASNMKFLGVGYPTKYRDSLLSLNQQISSNVSEIPSILNKYLSSEK
jgi:hypothetical protein